MGAMPEIVYHGKTGFIASNETDIGKHTLEIFGNPILAEAFRAEGHRLVQKFCYNNFARNIERLAHRSWREVGLVGATT